MTQIILNRLSSLIEWAVTPRQETAEADEVAPDITAQRFSRDEAYYWAMHAHW